MLENIQDIDVIITERFIVLVEGVSIFLLCVLLVYGLMAYKQYRFMKTLQLPGAWRAYIPLVSIFQWWDAGRISWQWLLLIFVPGTFSMILPWEIASLTVPLILLFWMGLTLKASLNIAKQYQVPAVYGYFLLLPIIRWYWLSQFFLKKDAQMSTKQQILKGIGGTLLSLVLFCTVWSVLVYLSFQQSIVVLMDYLQK